MLDNAPQLGPSLSWEDLRDKALAAAQANLEHEIVRSRGIAVAPRPIRLAGQRISWQPPRGQLSITVGSPRGVFWKEALYFLVDAALDARLPENRHVVEYRSYFPQKGELLLTIPPEVVELLAGTPEVNVFRVDPLGVQLAKQQVEVVEEMDRGPRAVELWSRKHVALTPWSPDYLPDDRALNPGQQKALAAMTTAGGFFVWGPPGTGKTTVITSAVHTALQRGKSVLITSHTNVAVDNVLSGLVSDDRAYGLGMMYPGQVVRHSGQDQSKVLDEVREHDFLLVDKAAALMTGLDEKKKALDASMRANSDHPDRRREVLLLENLNALTVDIQAVRNARANATQLLELETHTNDLHELNREMTELKSEIESDTVEWRKGEWLDAEADRLHAKYLNLEEARSHWMETKGNFEAELSPLVHGISAARAQQEAAELRLESRIARTFPWFMRKYKIAALEAAATVSELLAREEQLRTSIAQADTALRQISDDKRVYDVELSTVNVQMRRRSQLAVNIREKRASREKLSTRYAKLDARHRELRAAVGDPEIVAAAHQAMRESGHWDLVGEFDEVLASVSRLDEEQEALTKERARLQDEYEQTKRDLLAKQAPVVATTLTALGFSPELRKRRFDIVIIDEAASAEAAAIVYAAAKADETLAVVGDFLQNAPIAEVEDAVDDDQREVVRWQSEDVFALAGITDRASAAGHPRCVAITVQYRYPPIIADAVNEFCYDGLLESFQSEKDGGEPVITFFDTSGVPGIEFSRVNDSWLCRRTVEAAVTLASGGDSGSGAVLTADGVLGSGGTQGSGVREGTVGYVTPYSPQAKAAERAFESAGLDVEAGTSHRFQGREFDTVIFDLMQDASPRWVAAANLHGPKRAVSAAKLLNVALTRAKKKLYLIGDWRFVRGSDAPGMRALANLEGRANFEVRSLGEIL